MAIMLGAGGAGMIRQYAHAVADFQAGQRGITAVANADDAVFLVGAGHDQVRPGPAVDVANHAVALVDVLVGRAAITGHGHPAGVDDDPALVLLVADHRGHDRQRDVVDAADADAGHDQIEEYKYPGAYFGVAGQVAGEMGRRRRADADHGAGQAGLTQNRRGGDGAAPFVFGASRQRLVAAGGIAFAGVG